MFIQKENIQRIVTGIILGTVSLIAIQYLSVYISLGYLAWIYVVIAYEYYKCLKLKYCYLHLAIAYFAFFICLAALLFLTFHTTMLVIVGIIAFMLSFFFLLKVNKLELTKIPIFVYYLVNFCWLAMPIILAMQICLDSSSGRQYIIFLICLSAINDSASYFCGKWYGKRKMSPIISPNKTIEGAISGVVFTIIGGVILNYYFNFFNIYAIIPILIVFGVVSQCGDWLESSFKRFCNVKDSSRWLLGHGGMLDRIDGLIFSIPLASFLYFVDYFNP